MENEMSHIQELTNKIAELSVAGFVTERASVHGGGFYVLCPDMSRHDVIFDHEDDAYQQLGILRAQAIMALLVSVNRQRIERPIATAECFSSHRTGTLRDMTRNKIASVIGFQANRAGCSKTDLSKITIVSSTAANKAFETGVDDGVVLRPQAN